jgi:hypothetical protein
MSDERPLEGFSRYRCLARVDPSIRIGLEGDRLGHLRGMSDGENET